MDLPVSIEIVTVDRLGVETMSLERGYGIGVVPNCDGTYVRHASGYEAYEGFSPTDKLPNWRSAPIIPPTTRWKITCALVSEKTLLGPTVD